MLVLHCPNCGADCAETELAAGGEAHLKRFGPGASDEDFTGYLFSRKNPKGVHFERWVHTKGCRRWFNVARHTVTHEILKVYKMGEPKPDLGTENK